MKKTFICLILLVSLAQFSYATIWRVNNNPGVTADFTTAQEAIDGAAAGDTIHFEPSVAFYGNATMNKRLVLLSIGSFLPENPGLQYTSISANLNNLSLVAGADNSVISVNTSGTITVTNCVNVTLFRCRVLGLGSISLANADNTVVLNCFVQNGLTFFSNSTGNIISNNILISFINVAAGSSATFTNNVIGRVATSPFTFNSSVIQNNIFVTAGISFLGTSNTYQNNVNAGNQLPAGNINGVNMSTVFVNPVGNDDTSFVLQTAVANPAQGAGLGGIDAGAFGGSTPYVLGLIPAIPSIYKLQAPVTPVGNTMEVIISTRSNN